MAVTRTRRRRRPWGWMLLWLWGDWLAGDDQPVPVPQRRR